MKRCGRALGVVSLALALAGLTQLGWAQAGASWPMFRYDASNSGQGATGGSNGLLRWTFDAGSGTYSSAVIDSNGVVYVASTAGFLYAINPNGTLKWTFPTGDLQPSSASSPAIGSDGTIYAAGIGFVSGLGGEQSVLYAVNPDGSEKWKVLTEQSSGTPVVGSDGAVYVPGHDNFTESNTLYAFNQDGTSRWEFATGGDAIDAPPAIGPDGTIFAASQSNLYAINPDGTKKWSLPMAGDGSSPAVGPDGSIYVGSADANLYAIKPGGVVNWSYKTKEAIVGSPAIGLDGVVYVGSLDGNVYAVDIFGNFEWSFPTGSGIYSSPVLGADDTIYVASTSSSGNGNLYALNLDGAKLWTAEIGTGPIYSSPAIGADGAIYIGSSANSLLAVGTEVNTVPVSKIEVNPLAVVGGSGVAGTVTLASAAPPGGDVVTLQSGDPSADVPPFVIVLGGATTADFTIGTNLVSSSASAVLTATSGGEAVTCLLTVQPATLSEVSVAPASVLGGGTTTGTVTLNGPAPASGAVISLSSSNPGVVVPKTVTVGLGDATATFKVTTSGVAYQTGVTIGAMLAGVSTTTTLIVNPPTIASISLSQSAVVGGGAVIGTVNLDGTAGPGGVTVNLSSNTTAAKVPPVVVISAGQAGGSFTVTTTGVGANVQAIITAIAGGLTRSADLSIGPVTIELLALNPSSVAGATASTGTVMLSGQAPQGGIVVNLSATGGIAAVPASVKVPAGASTATFAVRTVAVSIQKLATIKGTYKSISLTSTLTVNPPSLRALGLNPTTVTGGLSFTGSVSLTSPAPAGGMVVKLASNLAAAKVPSTVSVPAGRSSVTFSAKTTSVAVQQIATLTANLNGHSASSNLTVNAPSLLSITLSPAKVVGGKTSTGTITLNVAAPPGGVVVSLSSSDIHASMPASILVPAGKTSARFSVTTKAVGTQTAASISANIGDSTKAASLTIAK